MSAGPVAAALASAAAGPFLPAHDPALLPEARRPELWNPKLTAEALALARRAAGEPEPVLPYRAFRRFFDDGDRQEYEAAYFGRRRRLQALGLAVLSGQADDLRPALEDRLWAVAEETTWALPAHLTGPLDQVTVDLFAAETASALTELRCLLAGSLDPDLDRRLAAEVETRVLGPYRADRTAWGWESADHNWAAVCGGAIGLAALWTLEGGDLARVLTRLGPTLDAYLSGFTAEGLCLEGMGYWTYGFGYFTAFAELLRDRTAGRTDLWALPGLAPVLKKIAAFPAVGRIGAASFARFSDAPQEYRFPGGIGARLVTRLAEPRGLDPALAETLEDDRYARWVRHLRDLCWTGPSPTQTADTPFADSDPARPETAEVQWFPDAQWLFVRGTAAGQPAGLAVKGGHNGEPHNHNDLGGFHLVVGPDEFVDDLGAGRYDRNSFREGRYGAFVNRSAGHSVPLMGGVEQAAGPEHRAAATLQPGGPELVLDLTGAYADAGLTSLERRFAWSPGGVFPLRVADEWSFAGPAVPVTSRLITRLPVVPGPAGARIEGADGWLEVVCEPPVPAVVTAVTYPAHEGPDQTAFCVDFVLPVEARAAVLTLTHHPHRSRP